MSAFSKTFNPAVPGGDDAANNGDDVIRDDKTAMNERIMLEHYDLTGALTKENVKAPGRARPGLIGVCYTGTAAQLAAIKATNATPASINGQTAYGPGDGALAYNTDDSKLYRFNSGTNAWDAIASMFSVTAPPAPAGLPTDYPLITTSATQVHLDKLFGSGTTGIKFSTTRSTFVTFVAVMANAATTAWAFSGASEPTASPMFPWTGCGTKVVSGDPQSQICNFSTVVPANYYFRVRLWKGSGFFDIAYEKTQLLVAEVTANFTTFNLTAALI